MRRNNERLAWTIMVAAFVLFCALVISVPLGTRWYLLNSETSQEATVTLISGTVFLTRPGAERPEGVVETVRGISEGSKIESGPGSQAALSFYAPDKTTTLGSLQLYGSSGVSLSILRSPSFAWTDRPHRMVVELLRGRARVNLAVGVPGRVAITLRTPHGLVLLDRPGSYAIEVTSQSTDIAVRDGGAAVVAGGQSLTLDSNERTIVEAGKPPAGVLTGERNLVVNGDFSASLAPDWTTYLDRYDPNDVQGSIEVLVDEGRNATRFTRPGLNWGRVGIRQKINRDIRDYGSLRLHLAVRINSQNILNCGSLGSECPLMVKIEYSDVAGNNHEWLQGFYFLADPANVQPTRCVTCPPPTNNHLRIQQNTWYLYDSPNLIQVFKNAGFTPATIISISIYAEGHRFESLASEVELLAGD